MFSFVTGLGAITGIAVDPVQADAAIGAVVRVAVVKIDFAMGSRKAGAGTITDVRINTINAGTSVTRVGGAIVNIGLAICTRESGTTTVTGIGVNAINTNTAVLAPIAFAIINGDTRYAITTKIRVAFTTKATSLVGASRIQVAIVGIQVTFIHINTGSTIF